MDALIYAIGVIVFVLGLVASIALHEVGHMLPAKKFGVKVTQYFVGFGKTVWSTKRGETEYGIKVIPLGGFVKLVGMLPPAKGQDPSKVRDTNTGVFTQLIADARHAEYEHVRPGEEDRLFYRKPWWQKLIVMASGPMVNIAIAAILFTIVFSGFGVPTATTTVDVVSDCVIPAAEQPRACTDEDPVAPARDAGLRPGDQILAFNGTTITGWDQLTGLIRANDAGEATIVVSRDGSEQTLSTDTSVSSRRDLDDREAFVDVGFLGVVPITVTERQGPVFVADTMWDYTKATGEAIIALPQRLVQVAEAAFGGVRQQNSPMSVVGASRVAGEVVTYDEASWSDRIANLIGLLAAVNLFVALFNFIPLLPLDGGHIAGTLWEALRRGIARLRGKPDPGHVDVGKLLPVAYVVGAFLMLMGVLLIYADIVNPVRLQ
ncbi:MAG: site-2 protease family protein [Actinomycetota bacterium]|nr:site-2 protease family protein [Actinomycetota bacterium]